MGAIDIPEAGTLEAGPLDVGAARAAAPAGAVPGRHPRLVLAALAMGGFTIGTTEFATMSLLPAFAPDLGIDAATAGHVISAYALGVVVGAPVIAVLAARVPRRTLLVGLMLLFALGNGLSALAPSYAWMLAFRFLSGLTVGNLACAFAADRAPTAAAGLTLAWTAGALALYPAATGSAWTIAGAVFLIGCGGGLATILQTRLMDVAEDAQTLAAALNHSAFNVANALGPWLAGLALGAGFGLPSTGWVGLGLALGGLALWAVSALAGRRGASPAGEML